MEAGIAGMPMGTAAGSTGQDALPGSSVETAGSPVSLRIMSYNVWNFDDGPDWEKMRLPAVADVIETAKPMLVGLQELRRRFAEDNDQGKQLLAELKARGLNYFFQYATGMQYESSEEGLGVLSIYPIRHVEARSLSLGTGHDSNQRICLMVEVEVPQLGPLQIYNTHLSYDLNQQVGNAIEVLRFADSFNFSGPQVLVGDMNTPPGQVASVAVFSHNLTWLDAHKSPKWPSVGSRDMPGAGFEDAWLGFFPALQFGGPCNLNSCTFSTFEPKTRCDYVLVRGTFSVHHAALMGQRPDGEEGAKQPPSDHLAVTVTLALAPP